MKEWLCLNCQMQRALGASEPPGFPMMKTQPSPNKEVPAVTQKQKTPTLTSQEDIPKPVPPTKETEHPAIGEPTKEVSLTAESMTDKTAASTISKTEQKVSEETPKGQPGTPQQQPPKSETSISKHFPTPNQETGKQEHPKSETSTAKSASPIGLETGKTPLQQPTKVLTSTAKSTLPSEQGVRKPLSQQPPKAGTSPAKSIPSPVQPTKESGGFFGFVGPKTQPTAAQSSGSVTGKMFGFGSSFLSSASTLLTSAVQDEPKTSPPTPRKMSTSAHVSPSITPPASPKTLPAKDLKSPALLKTDEKKPEKPQQTPTTALAKVDKAPLETTKAPTVTQDAPKADVSICPLCKVNLNLGSKDPPNYNTCTQCKTTVCNQCGFNPMPNVAEVNQCPTCCLCNLTSNYWTESKGKKY